jgi:hypothetical protein
MLCRSAAIVLEGRIGRDRLDPQILEQPIDAGIEVRIDASEDAIEVRHGCSTLSVDEICRRRHVPR